MAKRQGNKCQVSGMYVVVILLLVGIAMLGLFVAMNSRSPDTGTAAVAPSVTREKIIIYNEPFQRGGEGNVGDRGEPKEPYTQIGLLVSKDGETHAGEPPVMLPLFGRKMTHRDRYEYYTATDKEHLWKVPVQVERRDCQTEVGCEELYDGMDVVVPDYANKTFRARIYKKDGISVLSKMSSVRDRPAY
jgi:hypothetical protein